MHTQIARRARPSPRALVSLAALAALLLPAAAEAQVVRAGTGADATTARNAFRIDLGGGNVAGGGGLFSDATGARREITWDGVGPGASAPNLMPGNQFQARGNLYTTPGTGLQLSGNAGVGPVDFSDVDASYLGTFAAFSPQKLFRAVGSNVVDVRFVLPGTTTQGATRGFGSIFSDVDLDGTTSIEYFDLQGSSLGTFFAPGIAGDETFSFLGVSFASPIVGRVRITNGNAALGAGVIDGAVVAGAAPIDVVAMDDFVYGEVAAVPEPSTVALVAGGLAALAAAARRRRAAG